MPPIREASTEFVAIAAVVFVDVDVSNCVCVVFMENVCCIVLIVVVALEVSVVLVVDILVVDVLVVDVLVVDVLVVDSIVDDVVRSFSFVVPAEQNRVVHEHLMVGFVEQSC
jgi:hypothetical protein